MEGEDKAWSDYRSRFSQVYDKSNYTSPFQALVMRASHRLAERMFGAETYFARVLEIGAGTGEHLPFVRHGFGEYILTDVDPKTLDVAKNKLISLHNGKVKFEVQSGDRLTYPDNTFDRVITTHVLEHLYQPHLVVKEWWRVVRDKGVLTILLPTDPGFAWRFGRYLGPRRNAVGQGIAYDYVMAREHVNSSYNLVAILRHYFPDGQELWWPLPLPSIDLNLFFVLNAVVRK